jgi:hypothetical protein
MTQIQNAPLDSADTLETAGILGISPDDAALMSATEVSAAFAALKIQEDDRTVNADLLIDSSRIA